jgi:acetyl-CoA carboxylase biotin carboxyl carrier protein
VLRAPSALDRAAPASQASAAAEVAPGPSGGAAPAAAPPAVTPERQTVNAPLTGLFYTAPTPGATPYVAVGGQVAIGQVIGLIEAMKLFNEIKSDRAGRVVRVCVENGALVKAKQPLIEVEPL